MRRDHRLHFLSWDHRKTLYECFVLSKYLENFNDEEVLFKKAFFLNLYDSELIPHFRAEEEILLPLMLNHLDSENTLITKLLVQHVTIHHFIQKLKNENSVHNIRLVLKELSKFLTEHIRFEERILFETIQNLLNDDELNQIDYELKMRYEGKYDSPSCST